MNDTSQLSKLAELRLKTDHQLARMIDNALERGLRLASTPESGSEPPHAKAQRAYAEARLLLPKVEDPSERGRLEKKLERLRAALDRSPAATQRPRVQAAGCMQVSI